ncbi:MAG: carbohydrate-binding domain-containing protein [Bacteroidaceae bacterium]|nr:carbohydrate-binding domain-containing protein [Bacteroidaceae bacterium]
MNLTGGVLQLVNNGRGGKGIRADSTLVIGNPGAEGPVLSVKTTGMIAGEQEEMFPPGGPMGFPMPDFGDSAVWKNFPQGGFPFPPDFQPGEGFPDFQPGEGGFPFFPDSLRGNGGFPPMGEWDGNGFPMGFPGMEDRFVNKKPKAIRAADDIHIYSGTVTIACDCDGGEGIESKTSLVIDGGDIQVETYDDCLNAAKQIVINGGSVYCRSSRNDAIDSNGRASGAITINGGSIWALSEAGPPEEGLDTDFADIVITGGTVFSMGGSMGGRPAGPSEATALQPTCLLLNLPLTEGDVFSVTSEKGKTLFEFQAPFSMRMNSSVCSLPEFARDKTYYIKVNEETKRTLVFTSQCLVSSK